MSKHLKNQNLTNNSNLGGLVVATVSVVAQTYSVPFGIAEAVAVAIVSIIPESWFDAFGYDRSA